LVLTGDRSLDNQSGGVSAKVDTKRQCKIRAVEAEIDRIENPAERIADMDVTDKLRALKIKMRKKVGIS